MEDSTQFDLNKAIRQWRQKVGESPAIGQDALGELESHLVDAVQALRGAGLSDEEAFWVACRRLGPAETLEHEFAKVRPARVWFQRALWMVLGYVLVHCVSMLAGVSVTMASILCHVLQAPSSVLNILGFALHYGVLLVLLCALWRSVNRSDGLVHRVESRLRVRPVLASVMLAALLLVVAALNLSANVLKARILAPEVFGISEVIWRSVAVILGPIIFWPSVLGWLLRRAPRRASAP